MTIKNVWTLVLGLIMGTFTGENAFGQKRPRNADANDNIVAVTYTTSKDHYVIGEPVSVSIRFKNRSAGVIQFRSGPESLLVSCHHRQRIVGDQWPPDEKTPFKTVSRTRYGKRIVPSINDPVQPTQMGPLSSLKPGETFRVDIGASILFDMTTAGEYQLSWSALATTKKGKTISLYGNIELSVDFYRDGPRPALFETVVDESR